jgi:WD40 repeat protein
MLGNKRKQGKGRITNPGGKAKNKIREKSIEEKIRRDKDEEILSESEDANVRNDEFFEMESEEQQKDSRIRETTEERRLRLAKKFISKIGEDIKGEKEDIENIDDEVDDYLKEEVKKEKEEHFFEITTQDNFSPNETIFYKGHKSAITNIDLFSDSKKIISSSRDCRGILWDIETGKKTLLPEFSKKPLLTCILTSNDKIGVFGGNDRYIYHVDLVSNKLIHSNKAHNAAINGLILDNNKEQYYSISSDNTLKIWALTPGSTSILIETFYGHTSAVNDIDLMSRSRLLTCGEDKTVNLWKVDSQSFLQFKSNENTNYIKALNNDHFITSSYDEGSISLWRSNKKKSLFKLSNAHSIEKSFYLNHPFFFSFSGRNKMEKYQEEQVEVPYPILSLTSVKNSDLILSGSSNGFINFYRYQEKEQNKIEIIKKLQMKTISCINSLKFSHDKSFVVASHSKNGKFGRWDIQNKAKQGLSIIKLTD